MASLEEIMAEYESKLKDSSTSIFSTFGNGVDFNQVYNKNEREVAQYLSYYTDNTDFNFNNSKFSQDINDEIVALSAIFIAAIPKKYFSRDFYFSITNEKTSSVINAGNEKIASELSKSSKKALINNIYHSLGRGLSPYAMVQEYKATVGLTEADELAVHNYRKYLESNNREALNRKLRDKTFDNAIRDSLDSKIVLPKKQIEEITSSYRERLKVYRTEVIANNESLRAASISQYEAISQAKNTGALDTTSMRRFWVTSADEKVRMNHRAIPSMNPNGVGIDESFKTPQGPLKYPRDPNGSLSNIMNCRCKVVYKIVK